MQQIEIDGVVLYGGDVAADDLRAAARAGLRQRVPTLPCKFFYDEEGSRLFDRICELDEYYVTRTEAQIMAEHVAAMAAAIGPRCRLVEFGSGSSTKTRALLDHLVEPTAYVPVDISRDHLLSTAVDLQRDYPGLTVRPVSADYTQDLTLPPKSDAAERTVVYFPGSTLGNFGPDEAIAFLRRIHKLVGPNGGLLLGVDMVKDRDVLRAAYNDAEGVTAAFNRNVLVRLGRESEVQVDPEGFEHLAVWDEDQARIEMRLVARGDQAIVVDGERFEIPDGHHILTEYSHKYTAESIARIAGAAGFDIQDRWTDDRSWFSVQFLTPRD